MTDSPVYITITKENPTGQFEFMRILAKDKLRIVAQIDITSADLMGAIRGEEVLAAFTGGEE